MTSIRALENLLCSSCNEVTLHRSHRCTRCETTNNQSGARPIPKPRLRFNSHQGKNFDAQLEAAGARRRARQARSKALSRIRA